MYYIIEQFINAADNIISGDCTEEDIERYEYFKERLELIISQN